MLVGIYLSATPEDYMGNFTAYPGSHHVLEKCFQEKGGAIGFLNDFQGKIEKNRKKKIKGKSNERNGF